MRPCVLVFAALLLACGSPSASSSGSGSGGSVTPGWTFTDEGPLSPPIAGVSPGALVLADGTVRLYVSDLEGGTVYRSDASGRTFRVEATVAVPGSDPTVLALSASSYRIYFTDSNGSTRTIMTAESSDGLHWSAVSSTGISDSSGSRAWGVPNAVRTPTGTYRLWWVASGPGSLESIASATSTDGVVFLPDAGYRATGGYVDPQFVKAEAGDWVAVFSTTPALPPQTLHLGTSTDGLAWNVDPGPLHALAGRNVLDPASVRIDPARNVFRVYYAASAGADPFSGPYELRSGVLRGP